MYNQYNINIPYIQLIHLQLLCYFGVLDQGFLVGFEVGYWVLLSKLTWSEEAAKKLSI